MSEWFREPWLLFALIGAPFYWLCSWSFERAQARREATLLGVRAKALIAGASAQRRCVARWLISVAIACVAVAFARPTFGGDLLRIDTRGADIVVCLDVSRSMLARDLDPDRLRAARREIRALTERAQADRFALVLFAGEARLAVPLTTDITTFLDLVDRADPFAIARGGTDLAAALDLAARALAAAGPATDTRYGTVLLLTDGEDLSGHGLAAAERCREAGFTVHCVGFGTERGGKIPIDDGSKTEHFLVDASGREVVSALDPSSLRRIAESTGGVFLAAEARPLPLRDLYQRRIVPASRAVRARSGALGDPDERADRFQVPLGLAVILLVLAVAVSGAARTPRPRAHGVETARG